MGWLLVVGLAAVVGAAGTRLVRGLAPRMGLLDAPDGRRKLQARAVPVGGGLAVLVAAVAAVLAAAVVLPDVSAALVDHWQQAVCLLAAATLITAVGLIDDAVDLRARHKLLGQIAAAAILIFPGDIVLRNADLLGWVVDLGWFAYPITFLWFLAAINALNLLDGMDGLLGTVGVIVFGALAAMAEATAQPFAGVVALAMAGALAGFLRYNLPPASIYLGDCGSMLVGLVVGALSIQAGLKSHAVTIIAPTALLVLPFLDTTAAIVRRQLSGRGWAVADREHLHHVLLRGGLTARRVLLLVAALGIVAATGSLLGMRYRNDMISLITAGGVILTLVTTGLFGSAELRLIRHRTGAALAAARGSQSTVIEVRVPATASWPAVWAALTGAAADLGVRGMRVETFDGREPYRRDWANPAGPVESAVLWRAELSLREGGKPAGRVTLTGAWDAEPVAAKLATLSRLIEAAAPVREPLPAAVPVPA